MTFTDQNAESLGLAVGGKTNTALVHPVKGFDGRRIYIAGGCRAHDMRGPLIHLSGFTPDEAELLGAKPNIGKEYSSRITGFLPVNPENLKAAAELILSSTEPAFEPSTGRVQGMDMNALFKAASK